MNFAVIVSVKGKRKQVHLKITVILFKVRIIIHLVLV